jgi:hypothetical protein
MTIGNTQGANTAAVDDEPVPFQFGNITLAPAFTATVTMAQREIKNNTVTLAGGTLQSAAGATVTTGGTLTQNAGTLAGTWQVGNTDPFNPSNNFPGTMTIQLNAQIQNPQPIVLNAALSVVNGTLTWASGNIQYGADAGLSIAGNGNPNQSGTLTISGDASLSAQAGVNPMTIYNSGTIQKTGGAPTSLTLFDGEIENDESSALLQVSAGNLSASEVSVGSGLDVAGSE